MGFEHIAHKTGKLFFVKYRKRLYNCIYATCNCKSYGGNLIIIMFDVESVAFRNTAYKILFEYFYSRAADAACLKFIEVINLFSTSSKSMVTALVGSFFISLYFILFEKLMTPSIIV